MKKFSLLLLLLIIVIPVKAHGETKTFVSPFYSKSHALMIDEEVNLITEDDVKVKWSSSDKKVATVSKKGLVKAVGIGKTTIIAKIGKEKITYTVSVTEGRKAVIVNKSATNKSEDKVEYITRSKYGSITNGSSYENVVNIIGAHGSLSSYSNDETGKKEVAVYSWTSEDGIGSASVIFTNGKVTEKDKMFLD